MPYTSLADKIRQQRARRSTQAPEQKTRYRQQDRAHKQQYRQRVLKEMPFCAVDGEGGGRDDLERQNYLLLRAGEHLLFNNNVPLTTDDCLGFLSGLSPDQLYVAFYFDYDVTMILRDTSRTVRERILKPMVFEPGTRRATYVGDYEIEYMPRKYFKVKHKDAKEWVTINEVGPFFQCSFYKAITDWQIGTEAEREAVLKGKQARTDFETMTAEEIEYNRIECNHLEQLMTAFRDVCSETGYTPAKWQGPGFLASAMMKMHSIPKRQELALPDGLLPFANAAYYGGRFEIFKTGPVSNVHEYDIISAYPEAMQHLPCLEHGTWTEGSGDPQTDDVYCAAVGFEHDASACAVANLPIRDRKSGSIYWPYRGNGIYWGCEIDAAQRHTTRITDWRKHWVYHRECDCKPFKFIQEVFAKRKEIGKGTKGYSLKLAINSLYGKTAQSIGTAPYANPVWAGLITAHTRARLIQAYSSIDSRNLVMLATDGVYTTEPVDVPIGDWLGDWETKCYDEIFIVQPGIYFLSGGARPKTRGVPMAVVSSKEQEFRETFRQWQEGGTNLFGAPRAYPSVCVPLHAFIGLKLANSWGKPDQAGKWVDTTRDISFDFRTKREFAINEHGCIHTFPRPGSRDLYSQPYARDIGRWRRDAEELDNLLGAQPDFLAFGVNDEART